MIKVKTKEDVNNARAKGVFWVEAVCCKCGVSWTSIIPNAEKVVTLGCVECADWKPVVGIATHQFENKKTKK